MIKTITTHLEVDTKIVRLLSKSTYQRSFSSAIRELVSNAYDADSLSVRIKISDDYQQIEVIDDGNGMTYSEFQKYLTIAGNKSKKELTRKYSRNRIGQFGIGFLSIFPYCDELEIST
ncbi:MAG: ATP-binding protein, partial [Flavobacteriaceae bacterium]|nr:ATP-binding protein [Flavobacteriaceae bacterium]